MDIETMISIEEEVNDEYLKFDRIEIKLHPCPDVHAFILLNQIVPMEEGHNMITSSCHDEYWLGINVDSLAEVITREQIIELVRCGIMFHEEGLSLFT